MDLEYGWSGWSGKDSNWLDWILTNNIAYSFNLMFNSIRPIGVPGDRSGGNQKEALSRSLISFYLRESEGESRHGPPSSMGLGYEE